MSNIHSLNNDEDKPRRGGGSHSESDSDSDEGRQGFFVGGSDRSGQEVLGPNNRGDMSSRLFEAIQRAGAEKLTQEQAEALGAHQSQGAGTTAAAPAGASGAFRLGGHGVQSERMGGTPAAANANNNTASSNQQQTVVRLVFWRNGFSVDDGPLRQFEDPQNRAFLQAVMSKRIPPELNVPGREIDLRIERKDEEYQAPKMKPFSGKGHQLGSVTPDIVSVEVDEAPALLSAEESAKLVEQVQTDMNVDEGRPTTRIQIRIPGSAQPIVARLNQDQQVAQLRMFIIGAQPSLAYRPFRLSTVYPPKPVENEEQSIKDAGLLNAAVLVKFE